MQYAVIASTIDYLVANHQAQPDLDFLARRAGYETTHFQKIFKTHVGISPKRLVQYMNMRHARELLEQGESTLGAALETGLSGNGRLHDLFVSCEGATPGDIQSRGQGLKITWGTHASPLGEIIVAKTAKGICWLGFMMDEKPDHCIMRMKRYWPKAAFAQNDDSIKNEGEIIANIWSPQPPLPVGFASFPSPPFRGERDQGRGGRLKLDIYGTNFQIQVWQALLKIPAGETLTYQDIANQVGRPKASRAIGNAVGANPVSLLIPCHRVIRATGIIDNYGWGSPRKKLILAMEAQKESPLPSGRG